MRTWIVGTCVDRLNLLGVGRRGLDAMSAAYTRKIRDGKIIVLAKAIEVMTIASQRLQGHEGLVPCAKNVTCRRQVD